MVYSAFCNPNFIRSADPRLCTYTAAWFENLIAKSNPITRAAEKNRDAFFRDLLRRVEKVKQRILNFIEENA